MAGSNEAELTLVIKARNLAGREIDRLHGSLVRMRGGAGKAGHALLSFAKIASGLALLGIGALVLALSQSVRMAKEEAVGIAKMTAALKANVKGFKGNTDAIEAVIKKRELLAFSDDSLRASLTILVTKYHNVDKALRLQAVAMDLARLKGISLEEASTMLGKGLDGNNKILKQLGIVLPKTATEQQRLTAIQKAAAGQAVAYGKTAAGAQEAFKIALDDVIEDIGGNLLPIFTKAMQFLTTTGIPAIRAVIGAISDWIGQNRPLINQISGFVTTVLAALWQTISTVVTWIANFVSSIAANKDAMNVLRTVAKGIADAAVLAWQALQAVVTWIANVVATITSNKTVMDAFKTGWDVLVFALGKVGDAMQIIIDTTEKAIGLVKTLLGLGDPMTGTHGGSLAGLTGGKHLGPVPGVHAQGGWVGLRGPEMGIVGDRGPEYISPNHEATRGGGGGFTIQGVSERDLVDMIDRGLFFKLRRAPATTGRL